MTDPLGSVVVSADGTVVVTQNNIPAQAAALGLTSKVIDVLPTKSMISPTRTGNYEFFGGIFYQQGEPDISGISDSSDGLVLPLNFGICTQTMDSTAGKLPYLLGSKGWYVEVMLKSSDNFSDNWQAFWMLPAEHDLVPRDIYPDLNTAQGLPSQYINTYEKWMELDIYEGWPPVGCLSSLIYWGGQYGAPDPYGYSGSILNNYGDGTSTANVIDATQWHKFAVTYDGNHNIVWYRDDVEVFRAGDGGTPGYVSEAAPRQNYYIILGAQSHGTHQYSMTVGRLRAFVAP